MVCSPVKRVFSILMTSLLLISSGVVGHPAWALDNQKTLAQQNNILGITGVRLNPDASGLMLEANRPITGDDTRHLSVLKFPAPYRVLVEIPNARLLSDQTVFSINRNGIDRVELSENRSPFYSAVRAVVFVNDSQTLNRLNTAFEANMVHIEGLPAMAVAPASAMPLPLPQMTPSIAQKAQPLSPVIKPAASIPPVPPASPPDKQPALALSKTPQSVLGLPVLPGTSLIQGVSYRDYRLNIQAANSAELRVKNRFTLTEPNRLVLDIENAVLASKDLTTPIVNVSDDIRQIRVGQFDQNTVRVVIEGRDPELFETFYPGSDRSLLAVSPYSATSILKLSANTRVGEVQSIDLKRDGNGTILRLSASEPIVHRFLKRDGRVTIDLLNAAAHPTAIGFDPKQYPEIAKMRLEPLNEGQPNSKLAIALADPNVRVVPTLSGDGKVLELLLTPGDDAGLGAILSSLGAAGKAPFPARIVVDAGHGGHDRGANRQGVNEKDLNLSLALMVKDALEEKGFKVYMTRSTDVFLPLPQIAAITNQIQPDLFISVHHNASVNPALAGIETYYYTPQSLALAKKVHAREMNSIAVRDGGVKKAMFYVIHHTNVPAILCEVGYVSNPAELDDLQTLERKQKTSRAIADGVVDYLKSRMSAKAK